MKRFIYRSIYGIFFGCFVTVMFMILSTSISGIPTIDSNIFVKNALGSMIAGWYLIISPLFFEIDQLNLLKKTILHFIITVALNLIIIYFIGWLPFSGGQIFTLIISFLLLYTVIWLGFYYYYKNVVNKMNEDLTKL